MVNRGIWRAKVNPLKEGNKNCLLLIFLLPVFVVFLVETLTYWNHFTRRRKRTVPLKNEKKEMRKGGIHRLGEVGYLYKYIRKMSEHGPRWS